MNNKEIAKYFLKFVGGVPKVERFYNMDDTKQIDIITCIHEEGKSENLLSTIGLNHVNIGLKVNEKFLRTEVMMSEVKNLIPTGNILSSIAFEIMELQKCEYGMVIYNVINQYVPDLEMKHVVLLSPIFWDRYKPLNIDEFVVAWLLAIPISDKEASFIARKGINAFEKILEESNVEVLDFFRNSII